MMFPYNTIGKHYMLLKIYGTKIQVPWILSRIYDEECYKERSYKYVELPYCVSE